MKIPRDDWQIWLLRLLVLGACALMIVSFSKPWWIGTFSQGNAINIYGWGLRHDLYALASYIASDVTPTWQVVMAWAFLGVGTILALFSTWLKKWWGTLLLSIVGLGFALYAYVAINIIIKERLATFNIPLDGVAKIAATLTINTNLQSWYQLAYIAGGILIALALFRLLIPRDSVVNYRQIREKMKKYLSRREFLCQSGFLLGVTGLTSLTLTTSCGPTTEKFIDEEDETESFPASELTTVSNSLLTIPEVIGWPPEISSLNPPPAGQYKPSTDTPPGFIIPGCSTFVASDRYYSAEHIWAKPLGGNQFVIGVSDKLIKMLGAKAIVLEVSKKPGDIMLRNDAFAYFEGYKLNVDLMSPLNGKILQTNTTNPTLVQIFPYTKGWLMVIQIVKSEEIGDLYGPRYYAYLNSLPDYNGPMPDQHT